MPNSDAALSALFKPRIRELAARVRQDRRLKVSDHTVNCRSPVCGSQITLDIQFCSGAVAEIGWKSRACTLGMASLAILTDVVIGHPHTIITETETRLKLLLEGQQVQFPSGWEDYSVFSVAAEFPSRFRSILLPFEAIRIGFQAYENTQIAKA